MVRTLGVGGSEAPLGRSAPGGPPMTAGEPDFLWRKSGERTPGLRPGPGFLWPLVATRWFGDCWLWYGSGAITTGMLRPIWDAFSRENMLESIFAKESPQIRLIPPKPSPWGEGGPAQPGRMRGRFGTQPFLVEKGGAPGCRLNEVFLLPRWASRSPPHQSPSVTASPQGEAFVGSIPLQRNAFSPNPCSRKMRTQIRVRRWVTE